LQRARQLKDIRQLDLFGRAHIADFMVEKDAIFAELTLDPDELALYKQVSEQLFALPVLPDLVIYLQAPVQVLCERIAQRGIGYEQTVDTDYLQALVEAYGEFFASYDKTRLLVVDTVSIDLVGRDDDYNALLRALDRLETGRHYFNPAPW
jgi:deoxyadenosine/deoxycytidine kinase